MLHRETLSWRKQNKTNHHPPKKIKNKTWHLVIGQWVLLIWMNFMNALATFYSQKKGLPRGTHLRILNVMYDFPTRASAVSFPSLWSEHKAYCPLDLPYLPGCQELHALSHLEAVADEMLQGQEVLVQVFRSCERQEDTAECSHQSVALRSQDSRVSFRRQKQKTWPIVKPQIISLHHTPGEKNAFSILVKLSH